MFAAEVSLFRPRVLGGNCTVDETCDPATSGQSEAEQLFLGRHATQRQLEDFSEDR
jgi:hypothetical protein